MIGFLARRVARALSVVAVTLVATFALFFVGPADPAQAMCGERRCTPEKLHAITTSLGLDQPVPVQFGRYVTGLFAGRDLGAAGIERPCPAPCLGYSYRTGIDVRSAIAARLPNTVVLALGTTLVMLLVGIPAGVFAARRHGSRADRLVVAATQVVGAVPYYVVALLLVLYLVAIYPILPRWVPATAGFWRYLAGFVAPCLTLGIVSAATYVRYTRAALIDGMSADHIRTARASGLGERRIVYGHGLRSAMSPIVTILGLDVAALLGGTLITENLFDVDGIGRLAVSALGSEDLPVIMGTVLVASAFVVAANLVVDIAYALLDPRVRLR